MHFARDHLATERFEVVDKEPSVEVVYLVLDARGPETIELFFYCLSVKSKPTDLHLGGAFNFGELLGDRKTALLVDICPFRLPDDLGVDQNHWFGGRVLVFDAIHHDDTVQQSDLRRGKTDSRGVIHRFEHVVCLLADGIRKLGNRVGYLFQARVGVYEDRSQRHERHLGDGEGQRNMGLHHLAMRLACERTEAGALMNFDELIDRRGKSVTKWDAIDLLYKMPTDDALAMWIADMDFRPAACVQQAAEELLKRNDYGYFTHFDQYYEAVCWWAQNRHGWKVEPDWITITGGLGNAIALAIQTFTDPGDEIVIFTPVYQEFAMKTRNAGRAVRELPLAIGDDGKFVMDFDRYDALLTGKERLAILSSPHNPAGRVWSAEELRALVRFCRKHGLLLISDEVHQDIVFPGHQHTTILNAVPDAADMTVVMSSASKTFNLAGLRTGNVIIPDPNLRKKFKSFCRSLDMSPNLFGIRMTQAAYSPAGAAWVDALCVYLSENAKVFLEGARQIKGVTAMDMEATYLAWLDFAGTGLPVEEIQDRVVNTAHIAPTPGVPLGTGGATGLRFNLALPRIRIEDAVYRLQKAFTDVS